jgi:hypothetical protein
VICNYGIPAVAAVAARPDGMEQRHNQGRAPGQQWQIA